MELMKGDSLEVSDDTPLYNPQGLNLNIWYSMSHINLQGLINWLLIDRVSIIADRPSSKPWYGP